MSEAKTVKQRTIKGTVVSTAMQKTLVVRVDRYKVHSKYKKRYKTSTKFYAHDEEGKAKTGDMVIIAESRPLSKLKRWTLASVL